MVWMNETNFITQLVHKGTETVTGNELLTMIMILLFFLVIFLAMRINFTVAISMLSGWLIVLSAYYQDFIAVGVIVILYLGAVFAKIFFID